MRPDCMPLGKIRRVGETINVLEEWPEFSIHQMDCQIPSDRASDYSSSNKHKMKSDQEMGQMIFDSPSDT